MSLPPLAVSVAVPLFLLSAAVGVFASLTRRHRLLVIFKPLTTLLLLPLVGWPRSGFATLVVVGILFSLAGDVALLSASKRAFLSGLALFLVAHAAYIAGFLAVASTLPEGGWVGRLAIAALVMAVVTAALLRKLWVGAAGMRAPLVGYAGALALMVVSAFAAFAPGGVPLPAALGAALFYVSDASLALDRFSRPIKYAPLLTLGLYWLGQLGIALAARAS